MILLYILIAIVWVSTGRILINATGGAYDPICAFVIMLIWPVIVLLVTLTAPFRKGKK